MKLYRLLLSLALCGLALVSLGAQAAGVDVSGFVTSHADLFAGLSMLGFAGAVKTQGTELWLLDPADESVLKVGCVTTITGLTAARDQIETTCLDSSARTYEAGMATPGTASFTVNFDPADASHVRLHELYVSGTKVDWALGWSDFTPGPPAAGPVPVADSAGNFNLPATRSWITFNGYISDLPFDFALNTVVTSNISVQVSDFPLLVPKA